MSRLAFDHLERLQSALSGSSSQFEIAARWGGRLAHVLPRGNRLLVAGNGGSAAQAQHLTAELVGRFRADRMPFSAIALNAETSSLTAIANDYGTDEMFARQVSAHGRLGDVCILLSTSGHSANLVKAARRARSCHLTVWAMTGALPNPLASAAHEVLAIDSTDCAAIQEAHLIALHIVCEQFDSDLEEYDRTGIDPRQAAV
jgi:D-sedoheptulose 7-phosphate isomerase